MDEIMKENDSYYRDKRITGVEALIRWNHPSLGVIHPGEFIDHAEQAGVLNGLFYWIFEESCKITRGKLSMNDWLR